MQKLATSRRCGVLTKKVGMTRIFENDGKHCPVSVLQLVATRILDVREDKQVAKRATNLSSSQGAQKEGQEEAQATADDATKPEAKFNVLVAAGEQKKKRLTKPMQGLFEKANCPPMRKIVSFKVSQDCLPEKGTELSAAHFLEGQFVDVSAISIGKGFAGAMKRHGFKGLRATHGVSVSHRSMGSTGNREFPGKVFKGKKMPGRLGGKRITTQNLKVVALDTERNLILIKGAVPGARGGWVIVNDAIKKILPQEAPKPTFLSTPAPSSIAESNEKQQLTQEATQEAAVQDVAVQEAGATDAEAGEKA